MIYYNNGWQFHTDKAFFNAHGEPTIKYTSDRDYWINFVSKWWHHDSLKFEPITPTQAQIDRLAEIASVPEGFQGDAAIYVECGAVSPECEVLYLSTIKTIPEVQQAWQRYQLGSIPRAVSKRQAKQQLLIAGLLSMVQPAIDAIEDATQKAMVQIYWDDSQEFERQHPQLIALATGALGLTDEQLDALFLAASAL